MTTAASERRCTRTGLHLLRVAGDSTFRVAKPRYGALSAPPRTGGADSATWGRFDSPGRTLYVARDRTTAFAEVLSPFKQQLGNVNPLEADAAALGLSLDEFLEQVASDWQEQSFMGVGAVPKLWRDVRSMYQVSATGAGWWIDVEHPDSLAALEQLVSNTLIDAGIKALTTAVLRSENRAVTTAVGTALRTLPLDDGQPARGLQFGSKLGGGWCRAIWLPDDDAAPADLVALSGEAILITDDDLSIAATRFDIRVF
jgi:hypothetical protein